MGSRRVASILYACVAAVLMLLGPKPGFADFADWPPEIAAILRQRAQEAEAAYAASRFSILSRDYLARMALDPAATPQDGEVALGPECRIVLPEGTSAQVRGVASLLADFLEGRMGVRAA